MYKNQPTEAQLYHQLEAAGAPALVGIVKLHLSGSHWDATLASLVLLRPTEWLKKVQTKKKATLQGSLLQAWVMSVGARKEKRIQSENVFFFTFLSKPRLKYQLSKHGGGSSMLRVLLAATLTVAFHKMDYGGELTLNSSNFP